MPNPSDVPPGQNGGNVYLPHTAEAPSYEEYADPAAAHGWAGSAYDDTRELPRLAPEPGAGGRAERRRARRRATGWRSRRGVVTAGAVGAVSVAALVAGVSLSGSSSGGGSESRPTGGTLSASESAAPSGPPSATGTPTTTRSSEAAPSARATRPHPVPEHPSPAPGTAHPVPLFSTLTVDVGPGHRLPVLVLDTGPGERPGQGVEEAVAEETPRPKTAPCRGPSGR
ncbi:hypothetical protein [Streptomyces galbus]|uniref:hypothetical protein n=1 Tax=Streptomyces galbus TaxID=33898 RepID=UPI003EB9ED8D